MSLTPAPDDMQKAFAIQSAAEELSVYGYSIGQWLVDNGHSKIIVYTQKKYLEYFRHIILQLKATNGLTIVKYLSNKAFTLSHLDKTRVRPAYFRKIGEDSIERDCAILVLLPKIHGQLSKKIAKAGGTYLDLSEINHHARNWLFLIRPLLMYLNHNKDKNLRIATYTLPRFPSESLSEAEMEMTATDLRTPIIRRILNADAPRPNIMDNDEVFDCDPAILGETMSVPDSYITDSFSRKYIDQDGLVSVRDGHRQTKFQPKTAKKSIFMVGGCRTFGIGSPDSMTIPSLVQSHLNADGITDTKVENYGFFLIGRQEDKYLGMYDMQVQDGDLILVQTPSSRYFPNIDLSCMFERPHDFGEVFFNKGSHYNLNGNKHVSAAFYKALKQSNFFKDYKIYRKRQHEAILGMPHAYGVPDAIKGSATGNKDNHANELKAYQDMLRNVRNESEGLTGAIVMNCNPFTMGHRYLVENAASQVKHLYVFAVEEDKSVFPFKDRIMLMRKGTADISNVTVIPSGRFIISTLTFSSYFNKEKLQDVAVDPSQDVTIFAKEIAPTLGISVRFAGEEPFDAVTKQYNDTMERILPQHGIEFRVVKRKEEGGDPISASRVRKLLIDRDWKSISRLVPQTTLDYLKNEWQQQEHTQQR